MTPKHILLVEDHKVVMMGTLEMLKASQPNSETTWAQDIQEVSECLRKQAFDLVILDINIPGGDKPTMINMIKKQQPDVRILIFTGYDESIYAYPYLQAGADGFLTKNASEDEFKLAVDRVMSNQKYLSAKMQQYSIDKLLLDKGADSVGLRILSAREMHVLNLLVTGATTADIGRELALQVSTVSTHKMKIFKKLGVTNIVELLAYMKASQLGD